MIIGWLQQRLCKWVSTALCLTVCAALLVAPASVYAAQGDAHSGNWAMKAATAGGWKTTSLTVGNVEPDTSYTLGMWMKGTGHLYVKPPNGPTTYFKPQENWRYFTHTFHSGSGSTLRIDFQGSQPGTMFIDEVFLGRSDGLDPDNNLDPVNLVDNPGFEGGVGSGWSNLSNNGAAVLDVNPGGAGSAATNTRSGNWSLRIEAAGLNQTGKTPLTSVEPNTDYVVSMWVKGGAEVLKGAVQAEIWNSSGQKISNIPRFDAESGWRQFSGSFNTGSDPNLLLVLKDALQGTMYVDDLFVGREGGSNRLGNQGFERGNLNNWTLDGLRASLYDLTLPVEEAAIDKYGQWISAVFPGKVTGDGELQADVAADEAYYGSLSAPEEWDEYNGLIGSREAYGFEATGFFRVDELPDGRPVLVNPNGNLYFSIGATAVGGSNSSYTLVKDREYLYEELPALGSEGGRYDAAWRNNGEIFSHYMANLIRKHGRAFDNMDLYQTTAARLQKWGFTSEGGFTDAPADNNMGLPEVRSVSLPAEFLINGSLIDIFKPGVEAGFLREMNNKQVGSRKDDPLIVGYMFGNEMHYTSFNNTMLKAKASAVATKGELVSWLADKYGTIGAFNAAWSKNYTQFPEMLETEVTTGTLASTTDMNAFFKHYVDTFYRKLSTVFRQEAPHHLLLGERLLAGAVENEAYRDILSEVSGRYFDVISYNYYAYEPDLNRIRDMHEISGLPVLITEFHFGEGTRKLGGGLRPVDNEDDKGRSYRSYVEALAASGYAVGAHWFSLMDQPATGRWFGGYEGENYAIGLFDVTDRPYKTFLDHVMETNYHIYDIVLGEKEPYVFRKYSHPGEDTGPDLALGDVFGSGDGVTYKDARHLLLYLAEQVELNPRELSAADMNGDSATDILDVVLILQKALAR
ncbi:MAG: hypothetical protein K0R57_3721 [Paenibacillaceae bacterium]|nr:hypothetical protein [Paenibacillaceae bacterium]